MNDSINVFGSILESIHKDQKIIIVEDLNQYSEFPASLLIDLAFKFTHFINKRNITQSDKIVLIPNNSISSISIFLGASKIGVITCFVPIKLSVSEITSIVRSTKCKLVMCSNSYRYRRELYTAISQMCELIEYDDVDIPDTYIDNTNSQNSSNIIELIDSKAPISILFTSGSTGAPSGVVLSQESYVLNAEQIGKFIGVKKHDKYLQILPFYYIAGQITSVLAPLLFGADLIISNNMDPSTMLFCINTLRPTITNLVPTLLYRIHNFIRNNEMNFDSDSHELRLCLTGGADCSQSIMDKFLKLYNIPVVQGYGSTEAGCGICINQIKAPRAGSVGIPLEGHEVKILKDVAGNNACDAEEIGELLIRNNVSMVEYYENADRTKNAFSDGWYCTGDLGFKDKDGYIYIYGRKSDLIKRGGEKIYLSEIENMLLKSIYVKDCKVLSISDSELGELPVACVVIRNEAHRSDLINWINNNFSKYKIPQVFFIDEIPNTPSGKVAIYELKDSIERELDRKKNIST